jgi:transketolase
MNFIDNDMLAVNTIRALSIDEVNRANSGHTGITLSAAPLIYTIYQNMKFDVDDPHWINRDRFILSGGHGSAMLYATLHLIGFGISIDDLKKFRTLGSKTPGHPEITTSGVDAATGPLGQGLGMAVGMAMAEKHLSSIYNKPNYKVIDNKIYVIVGDGDLMEGISHESASLAGHLHLNNLIVLYDSNRNTMDASMSQECDDNVAQRFEAYGWNYLKVADGNNLNNIDSAIKIAKDEKTRPTLIEVNTVLGYGSPVADSHLAHGVVLNDEQVKFTKESLDYHYGQFEVPETAYTAFDKVKNDGKEAHDKWSELLKKYLDENPELGGKLVKNINSNVKVEFDDNSIEIPEATSTRNAIHDVLQMTEKTDLNFWGGSADLGSSDKTFLDNDEGFQPNRYSNNNLYFGIREFAEGAAINGITLYGGSRVFANTFLIFSDYMKNALRLASLMEIPSIFLFGHDSISLGPDGPTHQPIEQVEGLRAMPNLIVYRPADYLETLYSWKYAINQSKKPVAFILGRQNLPTLTNFKTQIKNGVAKGGYILSEAQNDKPEGILMATGSEVALIIEAQKELAKLGKYVRVVSIPSFELFLKQSKDYREQVLPKSIRNRVSVEMASTYDWGQFIGLNGISIGIDHFGESGDGDELIEKSGFTVENIVKTYLNNYKE